MRNLFLSAVLASASLLGAVAHAGNLDAADIKAGKHYVQLNQPVPVSQPDKIEVVELFWYGCPHCYKFESTINPWTSELPADVKFVRVPALFGGIWNAHGQLFYALEALKVGPEVHQAVFHAYHKENLKLATPEEMAEFLAKQGIDTDMFLRAYHSFGVKSQMEKAKKLAAAYQVTGVPALIVNGKYRFDIGSAGGPEQALDVADYLIDKERAAQ
jgi:thiol:disulfide interchange protein DsbA